MKHRISHVGKRKQTRKRRNLGTKREAEGDRH